MHTLAIMSSKHLFVGLYPGTRSPKPGCIPPYHTRLLVCWSYSGVYPRTTPDYSYVGHTLACTRAPTEKSSNAYLSHHVLQLLVRRAVPQRRHHGSQLVQVDLPTPILQAKRPRQTREKNVHGKSQKEHPQHRHRQQLVQGIFIRTFCSKIK